ncbi:hypothetical protein XAP412_470046 [Xanthomonas phaseoli pv. phaseoli]|uniref:Uncharacterized protein n=1 Tax=Xanthomonas campestris pv. phaseoli TaxID=317013 RepID=A0AB38E1F7_XANCH|nr:hypothetical protein XAP6984_520047 [Xanthomonas phaseoli pv. phaseoli]SON86225.1 hypothetical protein XAP412_470046 [Xanthomonas phaseoli pv. phaseoli]SON90525.1 hypothetical protein XAP7430_480095 [Xanthomonas phaseoli pv. phaseoli]SOO28219.1 hypothetical protein XAP6164_2240007 [Xanthomonas phaseoli pv. phaseoli]
MRNMPKRCSGWRTFRWIDGLPPIEGGESAQYADAVMTEALKIIGVLRARRLPTKAKLAVVHETS